MHSNLGPLYFPDQNPGVKTTRRAFATECDCAIMVAKTPHFRALYNGTSTGQYILFPEALFSAGTHREQ